MKKNTQPFSNPHSLRLAFASDFASITIIHQHFYGNFQSGKNWINISEVVNTLNPTCTSDELKPPLYTVNITFKVSYDCEENRKELERWASKPVIATYVSGGGKELVAGSKAYPLTFSYSKIEGFDGYACTLKGTQPTPESFM